MAQLIKPDRSDALRRPNWDELRARLRPARAPHSAKVLCIDTSTSSLAELAATLGPKGYACDLADDAATGFAYCLEYNYDVIILDMTLPGLGKLLVDARLLQEPAAFLLTGSNDTTVPLAARHDAGVSGVVRKPWTRQALVSVVDWSMELAAARGLDTRFARIGPPAQAVLYAGASGPAQRLRRTLPAQDAQFDCCATLAEARRLASSQTFDLIVAELDLPDACGLDCVLSLGTPASGAAFIGIAPNADAPFRAQALKAGALWIVTGRDAEGLEDAVHTTLATRRVDPAALPPNAVRRRPLLRLVHSQP